MLALALALLAPTLASPLPRRVMPAEEVVSDGLPEGVSRWVGTYTCAQGPTDLSLTITRTGEHVWATFAFGPLPENPTVPVGAFRMGGFVEGRTVRLEPNEWIVRPARYVPVGLSGQIDRRTGELHGKVLTPLPGCRTFTVAPAE